MSGLLMSTFVVLVESRVGELLLVSNSCINKFCEHIWIEINYCCLFKPVPRRFPGSLFGYYCCLIHALVSANNYYCCSLYFILILLLCIKVVIVVIFLWFIKIFNARGQWFICLLTHSSLTWSLNCWSFLYWLKN